MEIMPEKKTVLNSENCANCIQMKLTITATLHFCKRHYKLIDL